MHVKVTLCAGENRILRFDVVNVNHHYSNSELGERVLLINRVENISI